jgi:Tfp pilus assembly protein PilN
MIEINLLPEELKIKTKGRSLEAAVGTNPAGLAGDQMFIYAVGLVLMLFILAHFYFVFLSLSKNGKLVSLNRQWSGLLQQRKALEEFNQGSSGGTGQGQDFAAVMELVRQRIFWAQKMNSLSLDLPSGVWFDNIALNGKNITIQGSVISLQKEEVDLIDKLLENLKSDAGFSNDFSGFELSKIQKRNVGGYDIADFILVGSLKPR